jgi:hypothetical protein
MTASRIPRSVRKIDRSVLAVLKWSVRSERVPPARKAFARGGSREEYASFRVCRFPETKDVTAFRASFVVSKNSAAMVLGQNHRL